MEEVKKTKTWLLGVAIVFFLLLLSSSGVFALEKIYDNKVYPKTYLGETKLSGKTKEEVKKIISEKVNSINQSGIIFKYNNHETTIYPIITSIKSDLAYEIIHFDTEATVNEIIKKNNNKIQDIKNKIFSLFQTKNVYLNFSLNEDELIKIIEQNFSQFHMPAENATLEYKIDTSSTTSFFIKEEKLGKIINSAKAIKEMRDDLSSGISRPIYLMTETDYPKIYKKDCLNIDKKANEALGTAPLILKYEKQEWSVGRDELISWLGLKINTDSKNNEDKIIIGFNEPVVKKFLEEEVAKKIDKEVADVKFEMKDGKVTKFQGGQDGLKLNIENNFQKIENEFLKNKQNAIELTTEIIEASGSVGEINDLGIKEIIGTGVSNFAGSPNNRRHNIKTGANALNGLLIKPGEEFSLLKALGKIDGSTGYLQELVIKDNKTIPEYGGGLCQIGTTAFRATLASGLPVTLRRNHSYRVVYYEPAGTDATIYDPWPDYRFVNDTGNHILIQTRIEGDNLYFDFWGTKDGRVIEKTNPVIYNITSPGPTKLIETLDLEPGKKKCTERPHNGADAYFDYKVTYYNGETKEERFNSHYVPWQEVCLIGVEKLSTENPGESTNDRNEEISTSTPPTQ